MARRSFSSGRELRLPLGRDLADQDVLGLDLRALPHDPRLVEVLEGLLRHVRDVPRDVFLAQLRVARLDLELLDVDRGVAVVLHEPLGDQDRVLEVVPAPGHEGDEDVPPQRELALVGAGPVRDHLARRDPLPLPDDRPLVDARVLVRAPVLRQVVDLQRPVVHRVRLLAAALGPDHDAVGADRLDHPAPAGQHDRLGVPGDHVLHPGADERRFRLEQRHRLALHVRAHEGPVRVVVLEERDQAGRHRHQLLRRDVHVVEFLRRHQLELPALAGLDAVGHELSALVDLGVGLGDDDLLLLERREEDDVVRDGAGLDAPVRRLDEPELVDPRVRGERRDEPDVRAFRRLDRADPPVVRRVDVPHLEAGALPREPPGAERREPALVRQLGQRVRLVHELGELRGAEELLHHRRHRLRVHQVVWHQALDVGDGHPLLDRALHAGQAHAELVLQELAHRPHAPVPEVVDVIGRIALLLDGQEAPDHRHDVLGPERLPVQRRLRAELLVQHEAPDPRQVVAPRIEEHAAEERARRLHGRRIARAAAAGTSPPAPRPGCGACPASASRARRRRSCRDPRRPP